jgi:hypothetical protein
MVSVKDVHQRSAAAFEVALAEESGQEGTPFYQMSGRCVGQFSIINGDYNENGGCQYWNAAADKIFGVYTRKGDPVPTGIRRRRRAER